MNQSEYVYTHNSFALFAAADLVENAHYSQGHLVCAKYQARTSILCNIQSKLCLANPSLTFSRSSCSQSQDCKTESGSLKEDDSPCRLEER